MYNLPQLYGAIDRLCHLEEKEIIICDEETTSKQLCANTCLSELCKLLMEESQMNDPTTAAEAKEL